jgi:GntR family transcriptional regulator
MRRLVAAGSLEPEEAIPSVRELARQLQVNPATVSKAYQRLTDAGVLEVRRGEGTFVVDRPPETMANERERLLAHGAARYVDLARTVRVDCNKAVAAVKRAWGEKGESSRGGKG